MDYGHELLFGTFLTPTAEQAHQVVELAEHTEQAGLDLVSVQDHPYQPKFLDTWTLLSVIAARTNTLRVTPNVANLPLRPPAMLARAAASLDILSNGRVELGLGAGGFWEPIAGMGGPRRTAGESIAALEEAITIIRALWTPGRGVRLDGEHYQLRGAKPGPFPVHDIGIWVGSYKPRMLRLTGRLGAGWLPSAPYLPPDQLAAANAIIDEAATAAGRKPQDIRRLYNLFSDDFPRGPMKGWAEQLAELTLREGMSGYLLGANDADTIDRFAAEVVPAVRDIVGTERNRGSKIWDESTRPTGPKPEAGRRYTAQEQAAGQHLIDVHDHLRAELTQLRDLMEQVEAGTIEADRARLQINTMTMRQNYRTLGTYCESYCRLVTIHHTLEDRGFFGYLRRADGRLTPVVDRLEEEHRAIHGVIERVDRALVALVTRPNGITELRAAIDLLTDALLSHLSYEERELVEPLARLGLPV